MLRVVVPALRASSSMVHSFFVGVMRPPGHSRYSYMSERNIALCYRPRAVMSWILSCCCTGKLLELLEGDPGNPPAAGPERSQVAEGLRVDQRAEGVGLARDRQIDVPFGVGRLEEHPGVGAPLVELAGRVEEAGAEADGGGDAVAIPQGQPVKLQGGGALWRAVQVGLDGDVVAGGHALNQLHGVAGVGLLE